MNLRLFAALALAALMAALPLTSFAGTTGKIAGRVTDEEGNPLVGANVVIEGRQLGSSTDLDGFYFIIGVPPGTYNVSASYVGYQPMTKTGVQVEVDRTTPVQFQLPSSAVELEEAVIVVQSRKNVERDRTSTRKNISSDEIDLLPAETVDQVLRLQSGVVEAGGLHVRGGRSGEVAYMIDGHRVEDPLFGGNATDLNAEAIEQMELITGTYNAEYGNAMSGVVNIVTKENVERLKGRLRYKRSKLGLSEPSDNLNENYFEGSISGPLVKEMGLGAMISGRVTREDNYYESGVAYRDTTGFLVPTGELSGEPFGFDNTNNLFSKLYWQARGPYKLALAYTYDDREWKNYVHDYKYIPDSTYTRSEQSHLVTATFTHTLTQKLFYEVRLSYYDFSYLKTYLDRHWTEYGDGSGRRDPDNEFRIQEANDDYIDQHVQTWTGRADATWQVNRHNLVKLGAEYKLHNIDYFRITNPDVYDLGKAYVNDYSLWPFEGAVYMQDKVEFETIVLNLGLRLDYYNPEVTNYITDPNNPVESRTDSELKTQLSPRVGIAYPLSDRMVFHFAYGHFFQRPNFDVQYEDLSRNITVGYPLLGNPDLKPEKTVSYEFGVDTELLDNLTLQTTVFSKKINNLVGVIWQFKEPGVPVAYAYYTNEDFAYVKGFELNLRWRMEHVSVGANYTYSLAEGSSSSQQARYLGAYEIAGRQSLQFYPLSFDRRHTGNVHVAFIYGEDSGPLGGLPVVGPYIERAFTNSTTTFLVDGASGLPFTYNPTRSRYEPNLNNARMDPIYNVDLEFERRFDLGAVELSAFLQVYNLLDTKNEVDVYTVTGAPDDSGPQLNFSYEYDADPLNWANPRTVFLGLGVSF